MSFKRMLGVISIASLALSGTALAQSGGASGSAASEGAVKPAENQVELKSQTEAKGDLQAQARLEEIKQKGAKVSAKARAKAEGQLEAAAKKVNEEAVTSGDAKVASRLASEFGTTAEAMIEEKDHLEASWGELMIAHTLDANAKADVTTQDLVTLKHQSVGWGQIAAGLGLKLGDVQNAVQSEARVATGLARADGKVAVIHGAGARAGAGVGAGVGANASGGKVGAGVETGVGVKIGN